MHFFIGRIRYIYSFYSRWVPLVQAHCGRFQAFLSGTRHYISGPFTACVLPSFLVLLCVSPTNPPKLEWGWQCSLPQANSDRLYLNVIPAPSLVLIVYEMQPADSSQPSIFTPLSFSAYSHWGRTVRCARAVQALCEKLTVLHHREFGKFRRLEGCH